MPQMSPMNWLTLYMFFLTIFLLINMMNYYIYTPQPKSIKKKMLSLMSNNWKW